MINKDIFFLYYHLNKIGKNSKIMHINSPEHRLLYDFLIQKLLGGDRRFRILLDVLSTELYSY